MNNETHKNFINGVLYGLKWVLVYFILGLALLFLSLA